MAGRRNVRIGGPSNFDGCAPFLISKADITACIVIYSLAKGRKRLWVYLLEIGLCKVCVVLLGIFTYYLLIHTIIHFILYHYEMDVGTYLIHHCLS